MQAFCRIIELGTFSAVASEMNISTMMVSKYMAHLEKSLAVTLLNRTTRRLSLTEAGERYYQRCKQLLEDLNELDDQVQQLGQSATGTLKIIAPIDFGGLYMVPAIEAYQHQFPEVKVLMSLDNSSTNLSEGKFDIAILVTDTLELGIVAKKITETKLCTYAAPSKLKEFGVPQHPDDLLYHRCLHYMDTPHREKWIFNNQGESIKVKLDWHFASNNGRALCQAAALAMGIVQAPELSVSQYLQEGKLVEILQDYRLAALPIYATYQKRKFSPAKLTTFIEFLTRYFALPPWKADPKIPTGQK
jgi:DNA-binding transcriptional LysR family regulator